MYILKNYSEEIVKHLLNDILDKYENICKCDKCKTDIMALALNSIKPRYVVSTKGEILTKINIELNNQEIINITSSITQAIEIVSQNPHHET